MFLFLSLDSHSWSWVMFCLTVRSKRRFEDEDVSAGFPSWAPAFVQTWMLVFAWSSLTRKHQFTADSWWGETPQCHCWCHFVSAASHCVCQVEIIYFITLTSSDIGKLISACENKKCVKWMTKNITLLFIAITTF